MEGVQKVMPPYMYLYPLTRHHLVDWLFRSKTQIQKITTTHMKIRLGPWLKCCFTSEHKPQTMNNGTQNIGIMRQWHHNFGCLFSFQGVNEVSMNCSRTGHPPCLCCWDGTQSISLIWFPFINTNNVMITFHVNVQLHNFCADHCN